MQRKIAPILCVLALSISQRIGETSNAVAESPAAQETLPFQAIFNGTDLTGWHGWNGALDPRKYATTPEAQKMAWNQQIAKYWRVESGELVNDGHGPHLTTNKEYGDYELRLKYKTIAKTDSGIYLRGTPQVQIWDSTFRPNFPLGAHLGSGGLWNNSPGADGKNPLVRADKPFGQWNSFRILQVGARTSVWLNDQQVVKHALMENFWDRKLPLFPKGSIQLQTHGGKFRWKDIKIREIGSHEANQILASHEAENFQPIFDGKSFDGWQGAVASQQIKDGLLTCRASQDSILFTKKQYANFMVRFEFRLHPGADGGLAIRYPGHGNPAYDGMTELQILDDAAEKYQALDSRQFHGSAFGMAPAVQGYLRSPYQWNFQKVTVNGPIVAVELNGSVILNVNLSAIKTFSQNKPHPGRALTRGHFGFIWNQGFYSIRNVEICELPST